MKLTTRSRPIRWHGIESVGLALKVLNEAGISTRECLERTGIGADSLDDANARVRLPRELAFYRNVVRLSRDPLIGLRIGAEYRLAHYDMYGYALMSAASFRQVLEIALGYAPLAFTFFEYDLIEDGSEAILEITPLGEFGDCEMLLADREMSATHAVFGEVMGRQLPLSRVHLTDRPPDLKQGYRDHYRCEVAFGSERCHYAFPRELLGATPPRNNPATVEFAARRCELLVARLDRTSTLVEEVRQRMLDRPGRTPTPEELASELHLSARSLRRHLADEGSSYRRITEEVRFELSKEYLEATVLDLSNIAALLGYSDAANFSHAFKRWSGMAPSTYRRNHNRTAAKRGLAVVNRR